jgi:hypothetical protein
VESAMNRIAAIASLVTGVNHFFRLATIIPAGG